MTFKQLRKSKGLTQNELASKIGIQQPAVAMWETGRSLPRLDILKKISVVLGVTPTEVMDCLEFKE